MAHTKGSQGHILALAFRSKPPSFDVFPSYLETDTLAPHSARGLHGNHGGLNFANSRPNFENLNKPLRRVGGAIFTGKVAKRYLRKSVVPFRYRATMTRVVDPKAWNQSRAARCESAESWGGKGLDRE